MERDREAREKGEMKDNRSFLAKYVSSLLKSTDYKINLIWISANDNDHLLQGGPCDNLLTKALNSKS